MEETEPNHDFFPVLHPLHVFLFKKLFTYK